MLVCWMICYSYCCLSGLKCTCQLCSSVFSMSCCGHRRHVTLRIDQQHPITVYRTGFWVFVVLVLSVIRCSCSYFLDISLFHHDFHHDSCNYYCDFMAIHYFSNTLKTLSNQEVLVLQMRNSLEVSAPGHSPSILDWTCYLRTPFISCLHSLLIYSIGEFQALQLIVLAAFGASCMLVHFFEI